MLAIVTQLYSYKRLESAYARVLKTKINTFFQILLSLATDAIWRYS